MNYSIFLSDYYYVLLVAFIMILSGYCSHYNILSPIYKWTSKHIKNPKWAFLIISAIGGILPIPGRIIATAGMLDTMIDPKINEKIRPKLGVLNYLATHHYYTWSPLEKTIILPMAVLHLSYLQMLSYTWPLLVISLLVLFAYIAFGFKPDEFKTISILPSTDKGKFVWPWKFIEWKTLLFIYGVIVFGNYIKGYSGVFTSIIQENAGNFYLVSLTAFVVSLILGSSGKFAGIVALLCSIMGIQYLTFFMALEFSGYLLSPTHKCNAITCTYFNTPIKHYATVLIIWCILLVTYGIFTIL